MSSLKSLGRFVYVFYFGLIGIISIVAYTLFIGGSYLVYKSTNVLFISKMVTFHKTLLLLFIFGLVTWLLLKLFLYVYEFVTDITRIRELNKVFKRLTIHSLIGFVSIALYYMIGSKMGYTISRDIIEMNVLAVVLFVLILDLSRFFSRNYTQTIGVILKIMLAIVFGYHFILTLNGNIPVEFSSLAYLLVPIIFIFKVKKLYAIASYSAVMAGLFYYLFIIVNGGSTYHVVSSYKVYISMYSHGTLLLVGLVSMLKIEFSKRNVITIVPYIIFTAVWALINRPEQIEFRLFIYELLDGDFLYIFVTQVKPYFYILYYITILAIVSFSVRAFYKINSLRY